jgi:hypothetical protein
MTALSTEQQAMVALFQRHIEAELAGDLETTMATMSDDPHLNSVPTMAGGVGRGGVEALPWRRFSYCLPHPFWADGMCSPI